MAQDMTHEGWARPPPEPPPASSEFESVQYPLDTILNCLALEDCSNFAAQYVADEVRAVGQPSLDLLRA